MNHNFISDTTTLSWAYCKRNPFLAIANVTLLTFLTIRIFMYGTKAVFYAIFAMSLLTAIVTFFRLPLTHRDWLDIDDLFSCILHTGALHIYNRETRTYNLPRPRRLRNFFLRIAFVGVTVTVAIIATNKMDTYHRDLSSFSPFMAATFAIIVSLTGILMSAYLEHRALHRAAEA